MVDISIPENKDKIKAMLSQVLHKQGYAVIDDTTKPGMISIIKQNKPEDLANIREMVIALENSLYYEKKGIIYKSVLEIFEKPLIEKALERAEGNQLKAAKILGINRNTMRTKIKKLGINPGLYKQ